MLSATDEVGVTDDEHSEGWKKSGNCHGLDTELFYPEKKLGNAAINEAKAVCANCVVKSECLEYALTNGEHFGVWGGMSERERRRERRLRKSTVGAVPA